MNSLNNRQKYLATCLLATAALLGGVSTASAQVPLGAASAFAVLGGTNVTCTGGSVAGEVGVAPGAAVPFTDTGCTIAGGQPPATNAAAVAARASFLNAYTALEGTSSYCTAISGSLAARNLEPGLYCIDATGKTGVLTLTGPPTGVWTFLVTGALTGTSFSVVMAGGGQACNVFWAPSAAATMTTSNLKGTILAGNDAGGSITFTGGTLVGRALANVAVTTTGTAVMGCSAPAAASATAPAPVPGHHPRD
jgi:ice-binding like protein